jgi:hypothetical protein
MCRVNVGCGMTPTRGWRNFDKSFSLRLARHDAHASMAGRLGLVSSEQRRFIEFCRRERIEWADATSRIPSPDGSVAVLYSSYVLEHLERQDAVRFLREAAIGPRHHQWMYDGRSLVRLLPEEGFKDPVVLPPGQTMIPHAEPLDLHERADESVYVEARK